MGCIDTSNIIFHVLIGILILYFILQTRLIAISYAEDNTLPYRITVSLLIELIVMCLLVKILGPLLLIPVILIICSIIK